MEINGFKTITQIAIENGLTYHGAYSRSRRGLFGAPEKIGNVLLYHAASVPSIRKRSKAAR